MAGNFYSDDEIITIRDGADPGEQGLYAYWGAEVIPAVVMTGAVDAGLVEFDSAETAVEGIVDQAPAVGRYALSRAAHGAVLGGGGTRFTNM